MKSLKLNTAIILAIVFLTTSASFGQSGASCSSAKNFCSAQGFTISNVGNEVFLYGFSNSNVQTYFALEINSQSQANYEFTWYGLSGNNEGDNCAMFSTGEVLSSGISDGVVQVTSKRGVYQYGLKIKLLSGSNASFLVGEKAIQSQSGVACSFVGAPPCEECLPDFSPIPGKYLVSGWVKLKNYDGLTQTYNSGGGPKIRVEYLSGSNLISTEFLQPIGAIIDGWQKIEGFVDIPINATDIKINLQAATSIETFFDDIRFHPFDASMLTYVYDTRTLRLVAELDERNYATYYEYNEEGKLTRIKKETEKGIMTIQENRESIIKQQ